MSDEQRQYVRWSFYKLRHSIAGLSAGKRDAAFSELLSVLKAPSARWQQYFSLVGLRADVDFAVWLKTTEGTAPLQDFDHRLRASAIAEHIDLTHNYISMTKPSPYSRRETSPEREALRSYPDGAPYVFVYPMVKTRDWYGLPTEERGRLMREHIAVGQRYPKIRINTTYSYGLDDQEFVVAFEGDDPADFLDLVSDLRYTEASQYTLRDTPMFTCVLRTADALVEELSGGSHQDAAEHTILSLREQAEQIRRAEVARTLSKTSLSEDDRRRVDELSTALVEKLLSAPISRLSVESGGGPLVHSARALFSLDAR